MAETRSGTRNKHHDGDASSSSRKMFMTFDNVCVAPWSDLHDHVLYLVMMQLGVVDFVAFSGVCKSWRSLALSNRNKFMASRPPMSISFDRPANNQDSYCYLKDFEGRRFKTILPHSAGRLCIGVTCGYLILFGKETRDFWLVNPITRHQLHFPDFPLYVGAFEENMIRAVLVFSPSNSAWVVAVLHRKISFCIAGKRGWNHVSSTIPVFDLHAFKGKIYTLHNDSCLCELRLDLKRKRKWTLLEIKIFPRLDLNSLELVSSGENLYMVKRNFSSDNLVLELDFGQMKWVSQEKTIGEYAFFFSDRKSSAAIKLESWPGPRTQYKSYEYFCKRSQQHMFCYDSMWYFPHEC